MLIQWSLCHVLKVKCVLNEMEIYSLTFAGEWS